MKRASKGIGGALMTLLMAAGFFAAAGSTAQAQYRRDRYDDRYRRERDRDWRRERNRDVYDRNRNGVDDRYERGSVYDRNRNGVDDRYERGGGYGNYGYNIAQMAAERGYRDGVNTGASDGERGQNYNPQRSHYYKDATEGYNSSYGDRNTYKRYYREGFSRGYDEGYRQYAGYNDGTYRRRNAGSSIGNILGGIFGRP